MTATARRARLAADQMPGEAAELGLGVVDVAFPWESVVLTPSVVVAFSASAGVESTDMPGRLSTKGLMSEPPSGLSEVDPGLSEVERVSGVVASEELSGF